MAIRVLGEVTEERLAVLRVADAIVQDWVADFFVVQSTVTTPRHSG